MVKVGSYEEIDCTKISCEVYKGLQQREKDWNNLNNEYHQLKRKVDMFDRENVPEDVKLAAVKENVWMSSDNKVLKDDNFNLKEKINIQGIVIKELNEKLYEAKSTIIKTKREYETEMRDIDEKTKNKQKELNKIELEFESYNNKIKKMKLIIDENVKKELKRIEAVKELDNKIKGMRMKLGRMEKNIKKLKPKISFFERFRGKR